MSREIELFRFCVEETVFERFPDYLVGCVFASGIDFRGREAIIDESLQRAEQDARSRLANADLKSAPEIAVWRQVFSNCGWTPSKNLSSVEAIAKRVSRGDALPRVNPIVDLVNTIVLTYLVPIGAHDVAALPADDLTVRLARSSDIFEPMGDAPVESPPDGEVVYASGSSIRTRRWVWRQSRAALVTDDAHSVFFPVDGFQRATDQNVTDAVSALSVTLRPVSTRVEVGSVDAATREFAPRIRD